MPFKLVNFTSSQTGDTFIISAEIQQTVNNGRFFLINTNNKYREFYQKVIEQKKYNLLKTDYKDGIPKINVLDSIKNSADTSDIFLEDI